MQNMNQGAALPTGSWLSQERLRLGKTQAEVARAVQVHGSTLRSLEMHNRVLPPGWYPQLRALGIRISEPVWPAQMSSYTGADLYRDLGTCSRLRSERGWLSSQLSVSESAVTEVLRRNLPVPPSWLMKLAELGANVPEPVWATLYSPSTASPPQGGAPVQQWGLGSLRSLPGQAIPAGSEGAHSQLELKFSGGAEPAEPSIRSAAPLPGVRSTVDSGRLATCVQPMDGLRAGSSQPAAAVASPLVGASQGNPDAKARNTGAAAAAFAKEAADPRAASASQSLTRVPALLFHWNQEGDFCFSASALLLKQHPDELKDLLLHLHRCCMLAPGRGPGTSAAGS